MYLNYIRSKVSIESCVDESIYSKEAIERRDKVKSFDKLRAEGCCEKTILESLKVSRASIYRWKRFYNIRGLIGLENKSRRPKRIRTPIWTLKDEILVLDVRKKYKLWGKNKIAAIIQRDYGVKITQSTVGRIITKLLKKGLIKPVWFHYFGRLKDKKRRVFDGHAKRWQYGMKSHSPGELIQVDHATIQLDSGAIFKQFTAVCPFTKYAADQVYTQATSTLAADFISHMQSVFPFKIKSIQVDGGSEFMGDFEYACKIKKIDLFVLPPRSPKLNGAVERGNGTVKYEFYYQYDGPPKLEILRYRLKEFNIFYNKVRPHQALHYSTP
ncbi:MAG: transposase, partial [Candidatus Moranbacteria bacterium]|nr:transposase [Candidatus Moranbacteria bacterium]